VPNRDQFPQLLNIDDAARILSTSVRHVRRLVAERRIPVVKIGGLLRFDTAELAAWINASRRAAAPVDHYRDVRRAG
jgi:excisionase family DNA binding protein